MKRIISVVLIVACLCMLFSCGVSVKTFKSALENTSPSKITISTEATSTLGTLKGSYAVTCNSDGSATIKYSYELWEQISTDGSDFSAEPKKTVSGTVTKNADGTYSDSAFSAGAELGALELNLDAIGEAYTISENGSSLTADVIKGNTEAVFGVAYDYDVKLILTRGSSSIEGVTLEYVSNGNNVKVVCVYD